MGEYDLAPWLVPGNDYGSAYAATISRVRGQADKEKDTAFNRDMTKAQNQREQQDFTVRQKQLEAAAAAAADQHVRDQEYFGTMKQIQSNMDKMTPDQLSKATTIAALKRGTTGSGMAQGMRTLQPPKPQAPMPQQQTMTGPDGKPINYLATPGRAQFPPSAAWPKPPPPQAPTSITKIPVEGDPDSYGVFNSKTGNIKLVHQKKDTPQKPGALTQKQHLKAEMLMNNIKFLQTKLTTDEDANKSINDQIKPMQDELKALTEDAAPETTKESGSLPAGTKVNNKDGKVQYLKTAGTLPDGWEVSK